MTYSSIAGVLHPVARWCRWSGSRRAGTTLLFGILIGVASTAGQWIVVLAFRYADASVLAPFSYTQLLWVSILGFLIFGEVPDIWTVVGAAFIVASGLYTAHRERSGESQLRWSRPSRRRTPDLWSVQIVIPGSGHRERDPGSIRHGIRPMDQLSTACRNNGHWRLQGPGDRRNDANLLLNRQRDRIFDLARAGPVKI